MKVIFSVFLISVFALGGCHPNSHSQTDGHYEHSSADELAQHANKQILIPEYAPSEGVIISSKLLTDYNANEEIKAFAESDVKIIYVVGSFLEFQNFLTLVEASAHLLPYKNKFGHLPLLTPQESVWARDWSPFFASTANKAPKILDFNYYVKRRVDDSVPRALAEKSQIPRLSLPLYLEGGNFMNTSSGHCFTSDKVTARNAQKSIPQDEIFSEAEIKEFFKVYGGCEKLEILPRLPHEPTGHIDMWAKLLNDNTVLIGQMDEESVNLANQFGPEALQVNKDISKFLNENAEKFKTHGFSVVRVPMPTVYNGVFRSYTNSILLNKTAVVPRYQKMQNILEYIDAHRIEAWENQVKSAYENAGYEVKSALSDALIYEGGAVHCTAMQVPAYQP